jgi:hypothetical protein
MSHLTFSLAVSEHLGTSLRYVYQVPKFHKVVHLRLDHVSCETSLTWHDIASWQNPVDWNKGAAQ